MTIRIVENFWENVKDNEKLIIRCFMSHFHRHPDAEGIDGSFNNLMVRLYELKVFERFDLKKLLKAAGKEGILSDDSITQETLEEMGIDVKKKWEQFIYKWIEQVINYEYNRNGKRSRMFRHNDYYVDYGMPKEEVSSWLETEEEIQAYNKKLASYREDDRRGRKYAPTFQDRVTLSEGEFDSPLENLSAENLRESILKRLTGKNDKAVFELLEKGLSEKEICIQLNRSQQYINSIVLKIRLITKNLCMESTYVK